MVQDFRSEVADVNSRDVMELLLITQYFDTLRVSMEHYKQNAADFVVPCAVWQAHGCGTFGSCSRQQSGYASLRRIYCWEWPFANAKHAPRYLPCRS